MIVNYTFRRFYKTILIGFISLILFASQSRTFYTFSNGQSFTYWNILNNTYITPSYFPKYRTSPSAIYITVVNI